MLLRDRTNFRGLASSDDYVIMVGGVFSHLFRATSYQYDADTMNLFAIKHKKILHNSFEYDIFYIFPFVYFLS